MVETNSNSDESVQFESSPLEQVPVPLHLATDARHLKLCEIAASDTDKLYELSQLKGPDADRYLALGVQADRWFCTNWVRPLADGECKRKHEVVTAFLAAPTEAPSGDSAFNETPTLRRDCVVCHPKFSRDMWPLFSKFGLYVGFHCAAHAQVFHSVAPTTLHCCDPQYHPANTYAWRAADPWQDDVRPQD
jgi:hypothetical protein